MADDTSTNNNDNNNIDDDGWETVPKPQSRQNRNSQRHNPWATPPLEVEFIPPNDSTTAFEQSLFLLIGLPGSGKSTFSQALQTAMPYKFSRINQDELKTRKKCLAKAKQILGDTATSVIIDRCNFDAQQRSTWVDLAQEAGLAIHCLYFQVSVNECIKRCQQRTGHETVSPKDAKRVVFTVQRQFKLPTRQEAEQFKTFLTIRDGNAFNDALMMLLNAG